ncbi:MULTISPECIES: response regulator transcription factor [Rhizobium/Agrobacterium group]|uniref:Regulatory protein VirG n=2 Tax=Rhizobium/Agrobacterium group TaxID=227290 RepID=B9K0H5_ALLAM|nr:MULTISPECIES: response regulator transcription factor [Rhizobium/Agrobacterium group]ACM38373.1 two component response regulator [Allorhizobium ampelinum S4]MCF1460547.1 response regulator transcription factor [Allorhizobium ampelinum]MCF1472297.1 response regulator transcription factor [Allorhizobium ampelinum]MCF1480866.1 response regulator transcription factor [Allorhizobium ampelinum]MUO26932.1 response regulator [Agrobacterium vitis]
MSDAPKILIVEDDEQIAGMVRDSLNEQGMLVEVAADGAAMDAKMRALEFDLVVLDVMLPGEDGFSICRRLRGSGDIPILMLTSVSSDIDRVVGLEIGADDYVTKPFVLRELTARIKGLLRRSRVTSQRPDSLRKSFFRFDGWQVDPARRQLHDPSHARVAMTTHEFDLLLAFCQNPGRVLTREQLLSATHAGLAGPIERSIDVHISRLRQKIEKDPRDPALLKTVRLGGYVFTATVEEVHV